MGEQTHFPVKPFQFGDNVTVVHRNGTGAVYTAMLLDVKAKRAKLRFAFGNIHSVVLHDTDHRNAGHFVAESMYWWMVDAGTLDRLRETEQVVLKEKKKAAAEAKKKNRVEKHPQKEEHDGNDEEGKDQEGDDEEDLQPGLRHVAVEPGGCGGGEAG